MKILQKLKKYFKDNSEEQILADWEKTKNSDCINAPSVDEFLLYNVVKSLKVKKEYTFNEWANSNGYTRSKCDPNNYRKDSLIIDETELKKQYKERNL